MTKQWTWKHYNVESISTKELKEFYSSPSYSRKKEVIRLELVWNYRIEKNTSNQKNIDQYK